MQVRKWELKLHWQHPVSASLTKKKANMIHQKENPQLTTNTRLGPSVRESYLRSLPTDQPHVLFDYLGPRGGPHHTSASPA